MGETHGFFGRVVEAGFHQELIRMVRAGEVDASAIDLQVLAVAMRDDPSLSRDLRVIDSLGPSTIQPIVAARALSDGLKSDLQAVLLTMHNDPGVRRQLARGLRGALRTGGGQRIRRHTRYARGSGKGRFSYAEIEVRGNSGLVCAFCAVLASATPPTRRRPL